MATLEMLSRLRTAEEYLEFFGIDYDPHVVQVNRLHILRRFGEYVAELEAQRAAGPGGKAAGAPQALLEDVRLQPYRQAMERAYRDFVEGTALDHRVFKVLKDHAPEGFIPLQRVVRTGA